MGISTHVIGIRPPDAKYTAMKAVYDSCEKAGIDPPKEVEEFFDYSAPDDRGVLVKIEATKYSDDMRSGLDVDLSKLPKDVTVVRFYNSY